MRNNMEFPEMDFNQIMAKAATRCSYGKLSNNTQMKHPVLGKVEFGFYLYHKSFPDEFEFITLICSGKLIGLIENDGHTLYIPLSKNEFLLIKKYDYWQMASIDLNKIEPFSKSTYDSIDEIIKNQASVDASFLPQDLKKFFPRENINSIIIEKEFDEGDNHFIFPKSFKNKKEILFMKEDKILTFRPKENCIHVSTQEWMKKTWLRNIRHEQAYIEISRDIKTGKIFGFMNTFKFSSDLEQYYWQKKPFMMNDHGTDIESWIKLI